jgi:ABC-type polysaccharide/polyol phosphate export permease
MNAGRGIHPFLAPWIILWSFLRKIYVQRSLIRSFVVRDLKARYVGSFMGFFWSVIHPIVLLVSYTFVFSVVFGVRPLPNTGTTSFPLFLFCSILPWLFFQAPAFQHNPDRQHQPGH